MLADSIVAAFRSVRDFAGDLETSLLRERECFLFTEPVELILDKPYRFVEYVNFSERRRKAQKNMQILHLPVEYVYLLRTLEKKSKLVTTCDARLYGISCHIWIGPSRVYFSYPSAFNVMLLRRLDYVIP